MIRSNIKKNWNCISCDELVPANFSKCWNCGCDPAGNADANFVSQNTEQDIGRGQPSRVPGVVWFLLWILTCGLLMIVSSFLDDSLPEKWKLTIAGAMSLFLIGLIAGVAVNILAHAYPLLNEYLNPRENDLVQISEDAPHETSQE